MEQLPARDTSIEQVNLSQKFFTDLFGLDRHHILSPSQEEHENAAQVSECLAYLAMHAQQTLYPSPAEQGGLRNYTNSVTGAIRRIQALEALYVQGLPLSSTTGAHGESISPTSQRKVLEESLQSLRLLLVGNPGPGWMDGAPVDALRRACLQFPNERMRQTLEPLLEKRDNMRTYDYHPSDVSIYLLPVSPLIKRRLERSEITMVGQLPHNLTEVRGIGDEGAAELGFVLTRLCESHTQLSAVWLGLR